MKHTKLKLMFVSLIFAIGIIVSTSVFASNEGVQILETSSSEYMLYISEHLDTSFEFAFTNEKDANKEELNYRISAKDFTSNNIAYVDNSLKTMFSQKTYLWARTLSGEYFAEGIEINLNDSITETEVELANNITKMIKVDTTNTITTTEMKDGVKVTKTVGKVDVLEKNDTYYKLVKVENSKNYEKFVEIAEQIANNQVAENMYDKIIVAKEFSSLYTKLAPELEDETWIKVENNVVLQPEEAEENDKYVLWLKTDTKIDAQFLTCFEDYKPEVVSEKVVTKLPVTADDPTLFIILAALVVAFVVVLVIRTATKTKQSKH